MEQTERLREALIDLELARTHERTLREESDALLGGVTSLSHARTLDGIFEKLLRLLYPLLSFEAAMLLMRAGAAPFRVVLTTDPAFEGLVWPSASLFRRVSAGKPAAIFDVDEVEEWANQPKELRRRVRSALHFGIAGVEEAGLMICTHPERGRFSQRHVRTVSRVVPFVNQALMNITLQRAVHERDRFFTLSPDLLCITEATGHIRQTNPAWFEILGYQEHELEGSSVLDFLTDSERRNLIADLARLRGEANVVDFTARVYARNGEERWISWVVSSFPRESLLYWVGRDVTAQRRTERTLRQRERMASVGTLAAGMAHELNNPLAYVRANLEYIQSALRDGSGALLPDGVAALAESLEGMQRLQSTVRDLKLFSRGDDIALGPVDVAASMESTIRVASNEIRHRATLVRDFEEVPLVHANDARIGQVFLNLLVNAAQALPAGDAASNTITVRIFAGDDEMKTVVIEVTDTGAGIPKGSLERVFEPFFTTKSAGEGMGLGLSICHSIVTGLGGDLQAESEVGKGTTFRVTLAATEAEMPEKEQGLTFPDVQRRRVLIIDDDVNLTRALSRLLRQHEVIIAHDVPMARKHLAVGGFDLIFCDIMMPDVTGMELYREVVADNEELSQHFYFMTGGAFSPETRRFVDKVRDRCLDKPFDAQVVLDLVASVPQSQTA